MPRLKTITFVVPALLVAAGRCANLGLGSVVTNCTHNFAYTFADAPSSSHIDLVNKFNSVGAKATFFVNGKYPDCIYSSDSVRALRAGFKQGHLYAGQTWSHVNLTIDNTNQIDEEIRRLDDAFLKILGVKPRFFRPSFPYLDDSTAAYIQKKHGKIIVLWDKVSGDSAQGANAEGSVKFYRGLAEKDGADSTHLTLSQESAISVDAAVNGAVDALDKANVTLLTVAQCLDIEPYEYVGPYYQYDDTWTCEGTWTRPLPECRPQHYQTLAGETCDSIETKFATVTGAIIGSNRNVNCTNIPTGTNLTVCVPTVVAYDQQKCTKHITVANATTCAAVGQSNGVHAEWIKAWNPSVNCVDIWKGTRLCVDH